MGPNVDCIDGVFWEEAIQSFIPCPSNVVMGHKVDDKDSGSSKTGKDDCFDGKFWDEAIRDFIPCPWDENKTADKECIDGSTIDDEGYETTCRTGEDANNGDCEWFDFPNAKWVPCK